MDMAFKAEIEEGRKISDLTVALEVQKPFSTLILSGLKSIETREYPLIDCLLGSKIMLLQSSDSSHSSSLQSMIGPETTISGSDGGVEIIGHITISECYEYQDWEHWDRERPLHQVSRASKFEMENKGALRRYGWKISTYEAYEVSEKFTLRRAYRSLFKVS